MAGLPAPCRLPDRDRTVFDLIADCGCAAVLLFIRLIVFSVVAYNYGEGNNK